MFVRPSARHVYDNTVRILRGGCKVHLSRVLQFLFIPVNTSDRTLEFLLKNDIEEKSLFVVQNLVKVYNIYVKNF